MVMRWPALESWARSSFGTSALAVDMGTANTRVYVKGKGIVLNEPSVVAIDGETKAIKAVGLQAQRMLGRAPRGILVVRPLKDGVIADFDVTERMLAHFAARTIGKRPLRIKPPLIMCVPSGLTEVERRALRDAALGAGAAYVRLIPETMAAAIGAGLPVETPTGSMVIDMGAGITEIAVIAISGIVTVSSIRSGGDAFDSAMVQLVRKNYNLLIGELTAERIKIELGVAGLTGEKREMEVKGRDLVSGIPTTVTVHSAETQEVLREWLDRIVGSVRRTLEITPPELVADVGDRGILVTGGGALLRGLGTLLACETNLSIHVDDDPLGSAVRGAGRILEDEDTYQSVLRR
jgi:rod shape-determining protein MreB